MTFRSVRLTPGWVRFISQAQPTTVPAIITAQNASTYRMLSMGFMYNFLALVTSVLSLFFQFPSV